jgi:cysteine desulfurase / selenocysteine lyase
VNLVAVHVGPGERGPGDEILLTTLEHHSNIVPWQLLARRVGARLRYVDIDDEGRLRLDQYDELLSDRTKLVAVGHVSNALGTINPVAEVVERARAVGARVLVDGAQGAPTCPWTSRRWAATSTRSPATRWRAPWGSAPSGPGVSCWRRCRRTRAAAR